MPQPQRTMTLPDFLTPEQIRKARAIYLQFKGTGKAATEIDKQIIEPNLPEINRKLGQEMNARYLAYACEFVFSQTGAN